MDVKKILKEATDNGASDIFIVAEIGRAHV